MFSPKFKYKKHRRFNVKYSPFPLFDYEVKFVGVFTGFKVEVADKYHSKLLYENGCYGKGSKSRSAPIAVRSQKNNNESEQLQETEPDEDLILDLEESFFLAYVLEILTIVDLNGKELSTEEFLEKIISIKSNFIQTLVAYIYLKSKNWIIKSGIKYGGDFLLYKRSLREFHASFIVIICDRAPGSPKDVQGLQRIAETSDKDVLYLEIRPSIDIQIAHAREYLDILNKFSISEVVVRRFDYKQFVQNKKF